MDDAAVKTVARSFEQLISRVRTFQATAEDFVAPEDVSFDGDPAWVEVMLSSRQVHDEDFTIFRHFDASMGVILDVGAHWGYSVGSIRAAGSNCPVISIEVSAALSACLQRVKELDAFGYDFIVSAVGERPGSLEFYTPAINGRTISGLTTANFDILGDDMVANLAKDFALYGAEAASYLCQFLRTRRRVDGIDNILRDNVLSVPRSPIAAIKMDVEGFELPALRGAAQTLAEHKPLLLLESGNREPDVRALLEAAGYVLAARVGSQLRLSGGVSAGLNGIFVHPDRQRLYESKGLFLADTSLDDRGSLA
jgi:FkbM family methyltransferase